MSTRQAAITGTRWTTIASAGQTAASLLQIAILTRILDAHEFGVMAMASVVSGFANGFVDMGIGNAILHHQNITKNQLASLYWLNITSGCVITLLTIAISPLIGDYYGTKEVTLVLALSSLSLVFSTFGQQFRIVAHKNLRFSDLAKIDLMTAATSLAVAIAAAVTGLGVYSLVYGILSNTLVGSLLCVVWLGHCRLPRPRLNLSEVRSFLKFGLLMVGNNLAGTLNGQIDILVIGRTLGTEASGLYSLTKNLVLKVQFIVNPIVGRVALPLMARQQDNIAWLGKTYLTLIRMTSSVNFPIYVGMIVLAEPIVDLLFGNRWQDAVTPLQILSLWGMIRSTLNPISLLSIATGRADIQFVWNLALLAAVPAVILYGAQHGVLGVCMALVALQSALFIPAWRILVYRMCKAKLIDYLKEIVLPLSISAIAGLTAFYLGGILAMKIGLFTRGAIGPSINSLVSGSLVGLITYIAISSIFNKSWLNLLLSMARGKAS